MSDLISKRAALEAIQQAIDKVSVPKENGDNLLEVQVACGVKVGAENALLAVLDIAQPWISVKDELPEFDKPVLLLFPHNMAVGYMRVGYWSVASGDDFYTDVADDEEKPTHWMELPAPPAEAE